MAQTYSLQGNGPPKPTPWLIGSGDGLAVGLRRVMGQDEAAEEVVAGHPVGALPEEKGDRRRPDLLAGKELEMRLGHPGREVERARRRPLAADDGLPAPAPADGGDDAVPGRRDVEERQGVRVGGAPGRRSEADLGLWRRAYPSIGREVGALGAAAPGPVERHGTGSRTANSGKETAQAWTFSMIGVAPGPRS